MNADYNEESIPSPPEWVILGKELLESAMTDVPYQEAIRLLHTPGVDPALYMLFCALPQGHLCISEQNPSGTWSVAEVRSLMQCAFMLGTYVRKSVEEVEKLW